jgi:CRP-like cAMP-binding protein
LDNNAREKPYDYGFEMIDIEENLKAFPLMSLTAGEYLLTQEEKTDSIYFLLEGSVKVTKDGYEVAVISDKGAVFGEMSILLDSEHSASVQCLEDSKFYHIEHPRKYLEDHPKVIWHIAQILGLRLFNLNQYLVDVKSQYEGHDHLNMVDDVLETLLNQQKTKVFQREDSKRDTPDY